MLKQDNVIDIDLDRLEQEWLEQPTRMQNACKRLAKAKKKVAEAKANLELVHAKCGIKVRKTPRKYGLTKVTEPGIKETILTLQEYQDAQQLHIDAVYMKDNLEALVSALDHRKKALENEVTLWSQGYFSTPRLRVDASDEAKDRIRVKKTKKLHAIGRKNADADLLGEDNDIPF